MEESPGVLIDGAIYDATTFPELEGVDIVENEPFDVPKPRRLQVTKFLIHESVTKDGDVATDTDSTERILRMKGLGVHAMTDAGDGQLVVHNDFSEDVLYHARHHNLNSIGIEVVNPYYPKCMPRGGPWTRVINDAPWAHNNKYVVPTLVQLTTLVRLIRALSNRCIGKLEIPISWPGFVNGSIYMTKVPGLSDEFVREVPGIWAHGYTEHADGFFPVLFCWLVIEGGWSYDEALNKAIDLATGARVKVRPPKKKS